jgi:hypothetical protein
MPAHCRTGRKPALEVMLHLSYSCPVSRVRVQNQGENNAQGPTSGTSFYVPRDGLQQIRRAGSRSRRCGVRGRARTGRERRCRAERCRRRQPGRRNQSGRAVISPRFPGGFPRAVQSRRRAGDSLTARRSGSTARICGADLESGPRLSSPNLKSAPKSQVKSG